ncbi:DUF6722 family protein [uncultured Parabacteroides sp.]|uniref:DUF6722 family protein n=1 Tax=uncultured Parabacteroides sp. TaxID=512312 RepID=UPI0025D6851C|nr:DUF6722 family protein [uncultured Parabacteroides sp.]
MKRKRNVNVQVLPIVKEERISVSKEVAKYLLDVSKLIIGGAVITTALDLTSDKISLIVIAGIITLIFVFSGLIILIYKK